MTVSFFDVSVATYLQTLNATVGFLEKARAHFAADGLDAEAIVERRLYPDMHPFRYQVRSIVHHSQGALDGLRSGTFSPPASASSQSYDDLLALVAAARDALAAVTPAEAEKLAGGVVTFSTPDVRLEFTAAKFVLSFSLPNFYFHVTTAYDILRMAGAPVGKRDFLGRMRFEKYEKPA